MVAFRRVTGLPVSDVARLLDEQRPTQAERIAITSATFDQSVGGTVLGAGTTFAATAAYISSNRAIYIPFVVEHTMTVVKMFSMNGTAVSGNIDVGIYDENQVRLVSSGSTAQAGTSIAQEFNITDTTLKRGIYYMAVAMDNTTGTLARCVPVTTACGAAGVLQQATAFPLPDPAVFAVVASAYIPLIGITARTVL